MKKFAKILSCILSIVILFSVTACGDKECSHSYTSSITKEATCNETGVRTYSCRNCSDFYTEEIAKLTHSYTSSITKEATCNETGVRTYTCRNCDDSYTEEITKLTHSYTSSITKEATCDEAGVRTYTCRNCDDSYTEEITKLTHSYTSSITKEATCDEAGVRTYTCRNCGDSYTEEIAKSATHSYTSEVTKEATCKETGIKTYTCGICADSYTEDIPKTNVHTLSKNNICCKCGYGNTIDLNMSEEEKAKASSVKRRMLHFPRIISLDECYIINFAFNTIDSDRINDRKFVAVPAIIDIAITNINNQVVYSNVIAVKTEDFNDNLWCSVQINCNELTDTTTKIDKISYHIFNPGYFNFDIYETPAPPMIKLPTLPNTIYEYDYKGSLLTGVKVTGISCLAYPNYTYLYFSGEKTYDKEGVLCSRRCEIGYKIYDNENCVIASGVYRTIALAIGENFKKGEMTISANLFEDGVIYRLEILDVR